MKIVYALILLISALQTNAQQVFERYYTFNTWSTGERVLEIPGTGYITIGWNDSLSFDSTGSIPLADYYQGLITKIDYNGDTIKTAQIGVGDTLYTFLFGYDSNDFFRSGIITADGSVIVTGTTQSYNPESLYDYDLWLLKYDQNLDTLWTNRFSIPDSAFDIYNSRAIETNNGGIAMVGNQHTFFGGRQGMIAVFDSSGNLNFHQRILPQSYSELLGVAQTSDNGFICSGVFLNNLGGNSSPLIIKTDSLGIEQWHYTLPYSGDLHFAHTITKTQDGNYVFTWGNVVITSGASNKVWMYHATKIDEQGNQIWTKDYTYSFEAGLRVTELPNANLMFSGLFSDTLSFGVDALLMICDSNGDTLWTRKFRDNIHNGILCWDGNFTSDGGYILTGQTYCCNFTPNLGWTSSLWILKTDSLGLITSVPDELQPNLSQVLLGESYPNPSGNNVYISSIIPPDIHNASLLLFDVMGKQLQEIKIEAGSNQTEIDLSEYASGEYIVALSVDGFNAGTKKIIVQR